MLSSKVSQSFVNGSLTNKQGNYFCFMNFLMIFEEKDKNKRSCKKNQRISAEKRRKNLKSESKRINTSAYLIHFQKRIKNIKKILKNFKKGIDILKWM